MRFRKLRIAWSATCLLVMMALAAMWVRSYRWNDIAMRAGKNGVSTTLGSNWGSAYLFRFALPPGGNPAGKDFILGWKLYTGVASKDPAQFRWKLGARNTSIAVPYWFLIVLTAVFPALLLLASRPRFSLRALLIATTLVAVVLGAIVWLSK